MKYSVANTVAQTMKTLLNSPDYQSIFKSASVGEDHEDENDARKKKKEEDKKDEDKSYADDKDEDMSYADDKDEDDGDDCAMADDEEKLEATANYDIAIDSLLTASAALDELGSPTGSAATIKLASLIVEAKKKKVEDLKKKDKKDKNMAKGKMPPGLKKHFDKNKDGKLSKKEKEEAANKARKSKKGK